MGRLKPDPADEITLYTDPYAAVYKQLIIRDGQLAGAVLVGEDLNADLLSLHYTAKLPVPARRADLLFPRARAGDAVVDGMVRMGDANHLTATYAASLGPAFGDLLVDAGVLDPP